MDLSTLHRNKIIYLDRVNIPEESLSGWIIVASIGGGGGVAGGCGKHIHSVITTIKESLKNNMFTLSIKRPVFKSHGKTNFSPWVFLCFISSIKSMIF